MLKLTQTQAILLSNATERHGGSLYPVSVELPGGVSLSKGIATLIRQGFAEERETMAADQVYRTDGDTGIGVYVTAAGLQAIGSLDEGSSAQRSDERWTPAPVKRVTKVATVLTLLQREAGATLHELIGATGWLPHTTRAALTGLRRKGHAIERTKRDGVTCYRAASAA